MNEYMEIEEEVLCPECGSNEVYTETLVDYRWEGRRKVRYEWKRNTCMNLKCGHYWPEDMVPQF